ncbi:unnamed protein product [Moneuplotes crassus]|uniref:Uncharacterized protein n=1 Tax=Euplotes crassus TaxID=5936 RepID=A0AAD1XB52_EUPCR|nr:unnamed protein product [Moneuplotes crassus]
MKLPICEIGSCQNKSQDYIVDKEAYVCHTHKVAKYSSEDSIHLASPDSVELLLKVIDQCREEVLVSPKTLGYLAPESEYNIFNTTIQEAVGHISSSLEAAVRTRQFLKLKDLLQEVKELKDFIMDDQLFIKHSTVKSWNDAFAVVENCRKECFTCNERTWRVRKDRIIEEISELIKKLPEEKTIVKASKEELKEQDKYNIQDFKTQKERYKEKKEGMISTQLPLKQAESTFEKDAEETDYEISSFSEDIKSESEDLSESSEGIEELEQNPACSIQTFSNDEVAGLLNESEVYENGRDIYFRQEAWLTLKLEKANHLKFLTKVNKRIPDCEGIRIDTVPGENEGIKTFLRVYFPKEVGWFYFNDDSDLRRCLSFYMKALETLSPKVEKGLGIYNFEVSQHQMRTLLAAYKHKSTFGLYFCKLALSLVPDFGGALQGSQLEGLSLIGCGDSARGDWNNNPSHFENLVKGLAKE